MTDQEIVRVIAEKVMGWQHRSDGFGHQWYTSSEDSVVELTPFHPLTNDNDCMAAWDKAVMRMPTDIVADLWGSIAFHQQVGNSRRRAVCECLAMAERETPTEENTDGHG